MKKIQYLFATIVLGLSLSSCGDSFLTQYPEGGTLLQDQYDKLPDALQGSIMGIYSKLYEYSDHDEFGQRSIDMYGDIQSGDMAMKSNSYGWFRTYERGMFYAYARSYIWSFYYDIINLTNICAVAVENDLQAIQDATTSGQKPSDAIILQGYYYGQVLALRGWAYSGLLRYYCNPMDQLENPMDDEKAIPVYTAKEVQDGSLGERRATVTEVYDRVYEDLVDAITLLDFYGKYKERSSKLEVNADVARLILAYAMLNHGDKDALLYENGTKNAYDLAYEYATAVINKKKFPLLKKAELTTTGFCDVNAANWMWGEDVTVENTTALGSFFGQVDIHTYSYAAAGDTKGIDSKLYNEIKDLAWDGRLAWFRKPGKNGYCPDGKFYNPKTKNETDLDKVDRDWLCDNVFMRVELAYLIAAEAAWANGDNANAVKYIKLLCDERFDDAKQTEYNTWLGTLDGNADAIKTALVYNWRVEMWGEGYGLQTLRRLNKKVTLGTNHQYRAGATIDMSVEDDRMSCQCEIPTSETRYNPNLNKTKFQESNN